MAEQFTDQQLANMMQSPCDMRAIVCEKLARELDDAAQTEVTAAVFAATYNDGTSTG